MDCGEFVVACVVVKKCPGVWISFWRLSEDAVPRRLIPTGTVKIWVERFERLRLVDFFGVLHCVQDDSKYMLAWAGLPRGSKYMIAWAVLPRGSKYMLAWGLGFPVAAST